MAQQYGATGLLVAPGAPGADSSAADAAGVAEIPVVRVAAADAADLALWLRDYDVEARLRSSEPLAANDPSLTAAQRAVAPDGFHPAWSSLGDSGRGECGVPFAQRFHMPGGGNGNFWYAYAYGTVLMVHMSTEHDFTPGSPQHAWLNRTLAAVDREATAWVVVAMHRPIYSRTMGRGDQNTSALLQRHVEPLLRAHAVDVVLAGHEASAAPPPAPLPPVRTGHVSSLPPVLTGHVSSLPPSTGISARPRCGITSTAAARARTRPSTSSRARGVASSSSRCATKSLLRRAGPRPAEPRRPHASWAAAPTLARIPHFKSLYLKSTHTSIAQSPDDRGSPARGTARRRHGTGCTTPSTAWVGRSRGGAAGWRCPAAGTGATTTRRAATRCRTISVRAAPTARRASPSPPGLTARCAARGRRGALCRLRRVHARERDGSARARRPQVRVGAQDAVGLRLRAAQRQEPQGAPDPVRPGDPVPPSLSRAPSLDLKAPSIVRTADVRTKVGR
jgi:hypothetical protein